MTLVNFHRNDNSSISSKNKNNKLLFKCLSFPITNLVNNTNDNIHNSESIATIRDLLNEYIEVSESLNSSCTILEKKEILNTLFSALLKKKTNRLDTELIELSNIYITFIESIERNYLSESTFKDILPKIIVIASYLSIYSSDFNSKIESILKRFIKHSGKILIFLSFPIQSIIIFYHQHY